MSEHSASPPPSLQASHDHRDEVHDSPLYHSHDTPHSHSHSHSHSHPPQGDDSEEKAYVNRILRVFATYGQRTLATNQRRKEQFALLPPAHRQLLPKYMNTLLRLDEAIHVNASVLALISEETRIFANEEPDDQIHHHEEKDSASTKPPHPFFPTQEEMDKLSSTLKQMVRDWSTDGEHERAACYHPLLEALEREFQDLTPDEKAKKRVLIPGAGLGRLVYEVAKRGFSAQGNEFSYFMLFTSNYILNRLRKPHQLTIHPFIHHLGNHRCPEDMLRPVTLPDVLPHGPFHPGVDYSMTAGDFLEVYGQREEEIAQWDVILTCYFIDTAHNIIEYLQTIWNLLTPGGLWVNIGPLLWHFEGSLTDRSIEPTLVDVKEAARSIGFIIEEERDMEGKYASNSRSMLQYAYNCAFWCARRP
ncbi:MAG: N2227-like protein-domain-containing protein [Piptocephalis tieghemiana]|nr:MAG: N2227-like protein-domain-containing protein [Piptocephalis tieghemiana]